MWKSKPWEMAQIKTMINVKIKSKKCENQNHERWHKFKPWELWKLKLKNVKLKTIRDGTNLNHDKCEN